MSGESVPRQWQLDAMGDEKLNEEFGFPFTWGLWVVAGLIVSQNGRARFGVAKTGELGDHRVERIFSFPFLFLDGVGRPPAAKKSWLWFSEFLASAGEPRQQ